MALPLVINPGDSGHISHHEEIHAFLDPIDSPFSIAQDASGTLGARPAAGVEGRYYLATDVGVLFRDSGAGWQAVHDMLETWAASLLASGGNFASLKVPVCIATKSVAQTIPHTTLTAITFPTEEFDNDGMHSISTNTDRITPVRAGVYAVHAYCGWDDGAGSVAKGLYISKNGSDLASSRFEWTQNLFPSNSVSTFVEMNGTTDYLQARAYQNANPAASWDVTSARFVAAFLTSV